jgi:hypothetical protein
VRACRIFQLSTKFLVFFSAVIIFALGRFEFWRFSGCLDDLDATAERSDVARRFPLKAPMELCARQESLFNPRRLVAKRYAERCDLTLLPDFKGYLSQLSR